MPRPALGLFMVGFGEWKGRGSLRVEGFGDMNVWACSFPDFRWSLPTPQPSRLRYVLF